MVPYAAGGGTDIVARLIGDAMSRTLGQTVLIENVAGAGGTIANERVARSTPDGSTVLINHVALLAAPSLFNNLRYDTQTAFEPVGLVNNAPMLLVGRKSIPGTSPKDYRDLDQGAGRESELRAWRRRHQQSPVRRDDGQCARLQADGRGLSRVGAGDHRSPGGADRSSVGSGDECDHASPVRRLHGIAITSTERLEQLKDVPTTAELGMPEVSYTMWHGLYVAKGTPRGAVTALNAALRKALADPGVAAKLKQLGTLPFPMQR